VHPLVEEIDSTWRKVLRASYFQSVFGVPYKCLIPKGYDGILVSGPTISMTYMAHEPGPLPGHDTVHALQPGCGHGRGYGLQTRNFTANARYTTVEKNSVKSGLELEQRSD